MKKLTIFAIIMVLVCSTTIISLGADKQELENQQSSIQSQIDETQEELNGVKTEISDTMQEVQKLDEQISQSETEINQLNDKLGSLETEISTKKAELTKAQEEYDKQQELLQARVVAQYKTGKVTYLDVLLKSKSLSDFISNYFLISKITQMDTELLNQMEAEKQKIEEAEKVLEEKESEYKIAKASKEKANVILKNNKTAKDGYVAQLSEDEKSLQAQIDAKNAELARISQEIKKIEQSEVVADADYNKYVGGQMAWPTRITKRVNSIYAPNR